VAVNDVDYYIAEKSNRISLYEPWFKVAVSVAVATTRSRRIGRVSGDTQRNVIFKALKKLKK